MNPDGNERLTAAVGVPLLAPVLVEIATVLRGMHTFMSWHVCLALIPAVVLKLPTTGWRVRHMGAIALSTGGSTSGTATATGTSVPLRAVTGD